MLPFTPSFAPGMRAFILAALLGGCAARPASVPQAELAVRLAAAERGSDLTLAMECNADPGRVAEFAARDPAPPTASPALAEEYRNALVTGVRRDSGFRGSNPNSDRCLALHGRPEFASLWRTETAGTASAPGSPPARRGSTLEVGKGQEYQSPSDAIAAAHLGDHIRIHPGLYADCAVVKTDDLVIEGVGDPAKVVLSETTCEGKAILVTAGQGITIRGLTLTRAHVPDSNGAGIRAEGKDLTVERVHFLNNQEGILSGTEGGSMTVRDSVFEGNGICAAACAHAIYVGGLDLLKVERTKFLNTRQGHHIKSRALRTEVTNCTIQDGPEGTASYEIDLSNGGSLIARNNTIEKGPKAENFSAAIVVGAEGVTHPTKQLLVENNTFQNDSGHQTVFVRNLTSAAALLRMNRLSGDVTPLEGDGKVIAAE